MKHFFTLSLLALLSLVSLQAQSVLQFVDSEGNALADGATLTMNTTEEDFFEGIMLPIHGISIKNTSASAVNVTLQATVKEMPSGSFQCCLGSCMSAYKAGDVIVPPTKSLKAGATDSIINTEWFPGEKNYGTCLVEFQLGAEGVMNGPKLLVNFVYADPAASLNATSAGKQVVARYSIVGKQVSSAVPGITLVRYADGSVRKVLTK